MNVLRVGLGDFGPYMNLWREITEKLMTVRPGVEVTTSQELAAGLVPILTNAALDERLRVKAAEIVEPHCHDVQRNVGWVLAEAIRVGGVV